MLKRLGNNQLIDGYEKKPTDTSLGLSVEYVSLEKRTYLRKLGVVGGTCHHPASPLLSEDRASMSSSWSPSRSEYTVFTLDYRCDWHDQSICTYVQLKLKTLNVVRVLAGCRSMYIPKYIHVPLVVSSSIRSDGWHSTAKSGTRAVYWTTSILVWVPYFTRDSIVWAMPQLSACLAWLYDKSSSFRSFLLVFGTKESTSCTMVQKKKTEVECRLQVFQNWITCHTIKKG